MNKNTPQSTAGQVWIPSNIDSSKVEFIRTVSKIRKVSSIENVDSVMPRLLISKLWLVSFYRCYLKRYVIIRFIVLLLWRNCYPIYVKVHSKLSLVKDVKDKIWRPVIKLNDM